MRQLSDRVQFLVGDDIVVSNMQNVPALPLFADNIVDFLDLLAKELMKNDNKKYPDVYAYAFWIRKASLERYRNKYAGEEQRLGRGIVFHVTPSNIPVQFAVSLTYALISGNASIIRLSRHEFEQVNIICDAINLTIEKYHPELKDYICMMRYGHDDDVTQIMSDICDARLIWGGDETIARVRKSPIRPRCIDLGFSDRYSFTVINAEEYLDSNIHHLANDFYNDTYFSDQNACSSSRLVVWIGQRVEEAKEVFWKSLKEIVDKRYPFEQIIGSEKLLNTAVLAANHPDIKQVNDDNLLVRIEIPELWEDIMDYKGNCGYFFEYTAEKLEEIVPILGKRCQTVSYIGNIENQLRNVVQHYGVKGVDRIVPVGHAGDISLVWDGIDLPTILSRAVGNS